MGKLDDSFEFLCEIGTHKCEGWNDNDDLECGTGYVYLTLSDILNNPKAKAAIKQLFLACLQEKVDPADPDLHRDILFYEGWNEAIDTVTKNISEI